MTFALPLIRVRKNEKMKSHGEVKDFIENRKVVIGFCIQVLFYVLQNVIYYRIIMASFRI